MKNDKLRIIHDDGTVTEIVPLKMWDPNEPQPGSLWYEMQWCKVRGYIARASKPSARYWKNTLIFHRLPFMLAPEDRDATDWKHYDPQEDDGPLTA